MEKFGCDKPDLDHQKLVELSDIFKQEIQSFSDPANDNNSRIAALVVRGNLKRLKRAN